MQALHGVMVVGLNLAARSILTSSRRKNCARRRKEFFPWLAAGLAGILSNLTAGWLVDHSGMNLLYLLCGIGSLIFGIVTLWILPPFEKIDEKIPAEQIEQIHTAVIDQPAGGQVRENAGQAAADHGENPLRRRA